MLGNAGLSALPWAEAQTGAGVFSDGSFSASDHPGLIAALALAGILALVSVFLYKNRPLQAKLTAFSVVCTLLGAAFAAWLFFQSGASAGVQPGAFLVLPVAVFAWLAIRHIKKDEKLVRSADRLR